MATAAPAPVSPPSPNPLAAAVGGRLRLFGILLIVLGILAVLAPFVAGLAIKYVIAFLVILGGVARIGWGIHAGSFGRAVFAVIVGVLMILGGIMLLADPLLGLAAITLLLAWYFIVLGATEIVAAFRATDPRGRGWLLFDGVVAVLLGVLILSGWPGNAFWVLGLLVGIHLFLTGVQLTALGAAATRA